MPLQHSIQSTNLADILERVLDKGIVVAGDIKISLADVELLTIKIRLLIASVDKAREIGIDWWLTDPALCSKAADYEKIKQNKEEHISFKKTKPVSKVVREEFN
ncbi:MAG: gas vesicle protein [Firmicutes bacterium HGW-Firmicutes-13]|nr:MAG: gas vesicle protein [Firmicutes bacterium HGW-Firmicutes-13]